MARYKLIKARTEIEELGESDSIHELNSLVELWRMPVTGPGGLRPSVCYAVWDAHSDCWAAGGKSAAHTT
jgi:hypothetical protein